MAGIGHCLYKRGKEHAQRNPNETIPDRKLHIDGLRHETSGLCEKTNSIYISFLPLVHNHVQVIWVCTCIRCVTCVCARSGSRCIHTGRLHQRLTEGVSEAWCWRNFSSANGGVSQSDRLMQIPNPVHATPAKYVIGCCNYDGASAPRFRHALRQALTPTPRVNAAWARARAHTRHTPDACAHSDHLDMVVYKR